MSKTVSLYDGTQHILFDDVKHCYINKESGLPVAGVTSILSGAIPKPALLQWAANMAVDYINTSIFTDNNRGRDVLTLHSHHVDTILKEAKTAHRKKKEDAGTRGKDVHTFAERVLVNGDAKMPPDPETAKGCAAFLSWLDGVNLEVINSERIIFSKTWWYCGTTDVYGRIKGKNCVIDFKSGSGFYDEHPLQLAAYAVAIEEETGDKIVDGWIIHLDKTTGKPTPYPVPLTRGLKDNWLRVRESYEAIQKTQAIVKEIKDGIRAKAA